MWESGGGVRSLATMAAGLGMAGYLGAMSSSELAVALLGRFKRLIQPQHTFDLRLSLMTRLAVLSVLALAASSFASPWSFNQNPTKEVHVMSDKWSWTDCGAL